MGQASAGTAPPAPGGARARARARNIKAEMAARRVRMRQLGLGHDEVAAEIERQYKARPREAYRLAWGWTLDEAAARFNEHAAGAGTDPAGAAIMTGSHLCEYEKWPSSRRRPSVYVLCMLAATYQAAVANLLDLADHEGLPQPDRVILLGRLPTGPVIADSQTGGHIVQPQLACTIVGHGMSLTLPYVPGRLVIEVSGPPGGVGQPPADSDQPSAAGGQLTLVRDIPPSPDRVEVVTR